MPGEDKPPQACFMPHAAEIANARHMLRKALDFAIDRQVVFALEQANLAVAVLASVVAADEKRKPNAR